MAKHENPAMTTVCGKIFAGENIGEWATCIGKADYIAES